MITPGRLPLAFGSARTAPTPLPKRIVIGEILVACCRAMNTSHTIKIN
jgi:hypothetical protein